MRLCPISRRRPFDDRDKGDHRRRFHQLLGTQAESGEVSKAPERRLRKIQGRDRPKRRTVILGEEHIERVIDQRVYCILQFSFTPLARGPAPIAQAFSKNLAAFSLRPSQLMKSTPVVSLIPIVK